MSLRISLLSPLEGTVMLPVLTMSYLGRQGIRLALISVEGIQDLILGNLQQLILLSRKEADAALIIASDPVANFPKPAIDHITSDKCKLISIDTKNTPTSEAASRFYSNK